MNEVFHMVPATIRWGTTLLLLLPLVIVLIVVGAIIYSMMAGARSSTFEVSPEGLRLRGDFYGRMIPASHLRTAAVARVDLDTSPYRPTFRTNGIAVPGYRAGWFRLRNGRKGLLYVTDPTKVVVVPTTDDYDVLLSVVNADEFIARVRALRGGAPGTTPTAP